MRRRQKWPLTGTKAPETAIRQAPFWPLMRAARRRRPHRVHAGRVHAIRTAGPPWIVALVLLLAGAATATADGAGSDAGVWFSGSGSWNGPYPAEPEESSGPEVPELSANATWLVLDNALASYVVQTETGGQVTCSGGNATLLQSDGTGRNGRCGADPSEDNQTLLWFETSQQRWSGVFQIEITTPALASGPAPSSTISGTILAAVAAVGLVAGAGFAILFVRERRLTSLLARRLWEKSRSAKSRKEGEPLQEDRVRRIIVRSKN